jgi:hypothetical protein
MEKLIKMDDSLIKAETIKKAHNYSIKRVKKEYLLMKGTFPKETSKANPFNTHTSIIASAILHLMEGEGKEKATKEEIMERALVLGLYEAKPSKSSPSYIFSWWFPSLKANGFIA